MAAGARAAFVGAIVALLLGAAPRSARADWVDRVGVAVAAHGFAAERPADAAPGTAKVVLRHEAGGVIEIVAVPRDDARPAWGHAGGATLFFAGPFGTVPPAAVDAAMRAAAAAAEAETPAFARAPPAPASAPGVTTAAPSPAGGGGLGGFGAYALRLVTIVAMGVWAAGLLWSLPGEGARLLRAGAGAQATAAALLVLTLVWPLRYTMVWTGYDLVAAARGGDAPYGPAGPLWQALALSVYDHAYAPPAAGALLWLAGAAAWGRLVALRAGRPAGRVAGVAAAALPVLLYASHGESYVAPMLAWLGAAAYGFARAPAGDRRAALYALAPAWLAAAARPEAALLTLPTLIVLVPRPARGRTLVVSAVAAPLFGLLAAGDAAVAAARAAHGHLPGLQAMLDYLWQTLTATATPEAERGAHVFWDRFIVLRPALFPPALGALAAAGAVSALRGVRGTGAGRFALLSCLWAFAALVDLPEVSMPRVQAPAALFATLAAAAALTAVPRAFRVVGRAAPWLAAAAAMQAPLTVRALTAPGNADETVALGRLCDDHAAAMGVGPARALYLLGAGDAPADKVPRTGPHRIGGPAAYDLSALVATPAYRLTDVVRYERDVRCWAREYGADPPTLHPACVRAEAHLAAAGGRLVRVDVTAPNRRDADFAWYPSDPVLPLLCLVRAPNESREAHERNDGQRRRRGDGP